MHRSPAEPKPALTAASAARSRSASGSTTMWFFAPPSACTRLPARVPSRRRSARSGSSPTNETAFTSGCSSRRSTATLSPCTTLNTPAGSPASAHSAASQFAADGSFSDGLRITALPAAIAIGKNQHGTIAGKLNGLITATTPSGWRIEYTSTLDDTLSENSPLSSCAMPHANSTTSRPRVTSPHRVARDLAVLRGDDRGELFGAVRRAARGTGTGPRPLGQRRRRATSANAAVAAATAASTSSATRTRPASWPAPVAGSYTSPVRSSVPRRGRTVDPVRHQRQRIGHESNVPRPTTGPGQATTGIPGVGIPGHIHTPPGIASVA